MCNARTMKTALLAMLLTALVAPDASATVLPTDKPQNTETASESLLIAADFWDAEAPDVQIYAVDSNVLDAATGNMLGTMGAATGGNIWVDDFWLKEHTAAARITVCTTIVHEYGHVLGVVHGRGRTSIMRTDFDPHEVVYGCYRRFLPTGGARRWRISAGRRAIWLTR